MSAADFRVLVVDDDPDMQRLLALMIRTEGMQADTADDGDAALARASAAPPLMKKRSRPPVKRSRS